MVDHRLLLAVFVAACGGSSETDGDGGTGGAFEPASCDAFDRSPEASGEVAITIENQRPTPVFFELLEQCSERPKPEVAGSGTPNLWGSPSCGDTCSEVLEGALCDEDECGDAWGLTMLAPGASVTRAWTGGSWANATLPDGCLPRGADADDAACKVFEPSPPGSYTASVELFTSANCDGEPCLCQPNEEGTCDLLVDGYDAGPTATYDTSFTLPTSDVVRIVID